MTAIQQLDAYEEKFQMNSTAYSLLVRYRSLRDEFVPWALHDILGRDRYDPATEGPGKETTTLAATERKTAMR